MELAFRALRDSLPILEDSVETVQLDTAALPEVQNALNVLLDKFPFPVVNASTVVVWDRRGPISSNNVRFVLWIPSP